MERRQLQGLDPWSEEYQQRLAENIKQRNIRENMETALEHNPEIFAGRVEMLYLECRVNGVFVKALVDTGAQMTIMNVRSVCVCVRVCVCVSCAGGVCLFLKAAVSLWWQNLIDRCTCILYTCIVNTLTIVWQTLFPIA